MTLKQKFKTNFSEIQKCVVVMSGGMDSAIVSRLCIEYLGHNNVHAISFFYQQKQSIELDKACFIAKKLGINHSLYDISFLGEIARPISANISGGKDVPTIKEVLGDPTPSTYVSNRNAIFLMIAAAYAESRGIDTIVTGVQSQDQYGYYDTTKSFIDSMNIVLQHARSRCVKIFAPFTSINKTTELKLLIELDGNVDILSDTLTCYNPTKDGISCGVCLSCSERIGAFMNMNIKDPISYQISIPWNT